METVGTTVLQFANTSGLRRANSWDNCSTLVLFFGTTVLQLCEAAQFSVNRFRLAVRISNEASRL